MRIVAFRWRGRARDHRRWRGVRAAPRRLGPPAGRRWPDAGRVLSAALLTAGLVAVAGAPAEAPPTPPLRSSLRLPRTAELAPAAPVHAAAPQARPDRAQLPGGPAPVPTPKAGAPRNPARPATTTGRRATGGKMPRQPQSPNPRGRTATTAAANPPGVPPLSASVRGQLAAAARITGLPVALLRAVATVESQGDPWAVSPAGAEGLMQLEPVTAASLGVSDVFDVAQNARGGARYLAGLLRTYGGGRGTCVTTPTGCPQALRLALAAYDAGPGTVRRYGGVPPYPETQRYVRLVTGLYRRLTAQRIR